MKDKRIISLFLSILFFISVLPCMFSLKAKAAKIGDYNVGDCIEFGWYPQSEVTDPSLKSELSALGGEWISYDYYSGTGSFDGNIISGDWMKYKDVLYNGKKYRAVRFSQYRPFVTNCESSTANTFQFDNCYFTHTIYWFEFEPILWRVLDPSTGMVMSELILDSQAFQNTIYKYESEYYQDSACSIYANNYEQSSIRAWLNNDFFNNAFSAMQQNAIKYTDLDNSAYSNTYSQYNSNNTVDKIYLLSFDDCVNSDYGFSTSYSSTDSARLAIGTDYAKCNGLFVDELLPERSHWWLRTPGELSSVAVHEYCLGAMSCGAGRMVNGTDYGVRPVFNINPQSELFQSLVSEVGVYSTSGHSHVWNNGEVIKNATCSETGTRHFTCTFAGCGETYEEVIGIDSENHIHTQNFPESSSTCVTPGFTAGVYCSDCNQFISGHNEKQLAYHTWNDGNVVLKSTCRTTGTLLFCCTVEGCGATLEKEIPVDPDAHLFNATVVDPTCVEAGYSGSVCSVCGHTEVVEEFDPLGHTYAIRITPATCTNAGITTYTCTLCGDSYTTDPVPVLGHVDSDGDNYCDYGCGTYMGEPQSNCVCGQYHTGPFAGIIIFFHRIVYFFQNLFK